MQIHLLQTNADKLIKGVHDSPMSSEERREMRNDVLTSTGVGAVKGIVAGAAIAKTLGLPNSKLLALLPLGLLTGAMEGGFTAMHDYDLIKAKHDNTRNAYQALSQNPNLHNAIGALSAPTFSPKPGIMARLLRQHMSPVMDAARTHGATGTLEHFKMLEDQQKQVK